MRRLVYGRSFATGRTSIGSILTSLIYLRGCCSVTVLDMTGGSVFGTRHALLIWNLADDGAEDSLQSIERGETTGGMLFWIPLMHGADNPLLVERWKSAVEAIAPKGRKGRKSASLWFSPIWQDTMPSRSKNWRNGS